MAQYAGVTPKVIHSSAALKMLGLGNATVNSSVATPMPMTFAPTMNTVRISWIRTRRRAWLSDTLPSSQEP